MLWGERRAKQKERTHDGLQHPFYLPNFFQRHQSTWSNSGRYLPSQRCHSRSEPQTTWLQSEFLSHMIILAPVCVCYVQILHFLFAKTYIQMQVAIKYKTQIFILKMLCMHNVSFSGCKDVAGYNQNIPFSYLLNASRYHRASPLSHVVCKSQHPQI